ncbi:MAG: hypothetical protein IJV03_02950 [Alphaproteobacteria bacterium]|nr:hypothetical protein [Alphaproteobacteria bacterium]
MNKILKILVKETIHNNIISNRATNSGNQYIVFDKNGHEILSVHNGWATNQYNIMIDGKNILSVKWDETNSKPLTGEQKDMLDIINACKEKIDLQETAQTMNHKELELANFLQTKLCSVKH